MAESELLTPYRVDDSGAVLQLIRLLAMQAAARGDGSAFTAAMKEFHRRLALYPQFGDPQINLTGAPGIVYQGIIRPLSIRYGVFEDRRLVFVGALPVLLPMDRPEAEGTSE